MPHKCVFLDRDGVLNLDNPNYTYRPEELFFIENSKEALWLLKRAGFKVVVITNQSGIEKGIYTHQDVALIHRLMQEYYEYAIDAFYYSPYHHSVSANFSSKPGSLLFEKAIAKFNIQVEHSWMIGDRERDLIPAQRLGIRSILVGENPENLQVEFYARNLYDAVQKFILC
ncbi:MAG: HAD-IIIA family hydrolase [Cytophagales bacterium]|nr:HAD-IIIA family hydrolase [Cytophagales bacterium]MDW8384330.1 HAD-IIIA family hydrolase [Flammeovirgaceae bacterium]